MDVYLDHAATTMLSESMKEYLASVLDIYGNPSSLHSQGEQAKKLITESRQSVANFINADSKDIYFTPSASASNTLAVRGYDLQHNCTILYSPIAHKSILKCAESCKNSHPLKVDTNGSINVDDLNKRIDTRQAAPFVVIDHANSEIGTIQDIEKIIDLVHFYNGIVYLDCTGSISTIPIDAKKLDADMIGFSAHKLGGLKGCGILYKKENIELEPLVYGSQEQSLVGGTENTLGIASLGKAVSDYDYASISSYSRDYVYDYIVNHIPDCYLVGAPIESGKRLPHNLYMCFQGVESESLTVLLDMYGIQVSTGSACNSRSISASTTLSAIGMDKKDIYSCIRMTFSKEESKETLDYVCTILKRSVETCRNLNKKQ